MCRKQKNERPMVGWKVEEEKGVVEDEGEGVVK